MADLHVPLLNPVPSAASAVFVSLRKVLGLSLGLFTVGLGASRFRLMRSQGETLSQTHFNSLNPPAINAQVTEKVLVQPNGGAVPFLALMTPPGPTCFFATTEQASQAPFASDARKEPGWLYGVKMATGSQKVAVATGYSSDVLQGMLLCWTAGSAQKRLRQVDEWRNKERLGGSREIVLAVKQDGSTVKTVCYLQATTKPTNAPLGFQAWDKLDQWLDNVQGGEKWNEGSMFFKGPWRPTSEEHSAVPVKILEGSIPEGMDGIFLRNGPNPIPEHAQSKKYHIFDGHGHIHAVRLQAATKDHPAKALYSNAYMRTSMYIKELENGRNYFTRLGEMEGIAGLTKILMISPQKIKQAGVGPLQGTANTAIMGWQGRLYALHEASVLFEFSVSEDGAISSVGWEDFGVLDFPFTAHPKICPLTNDLLFMGYSPLKEPNFKWGVFQPAGASSQKLLHYKELNPPAEKKKAGGSFSHDMFVTKNYILIPDGSVRFDSKGLFTGEGFFRWSNETMAKIAVVNRKTGHVEWISLEQPLGFFHVLHAWESATDEIKAWAPMLTSFDGRNQQSYEINPVDPHMGELNINLKTKKMTHTPLGGKGGALQVEFCRMHPAFTGLPARFGFCGINSHVVGSYAGIAKFDMTRGTENALVEEIRFGEGRLGAETVFAPRNMKPVATAHSDGSDEGWLVTFIYVDATDTTELVIWDAATMRQQHVVRMEIPHRVPFGFHGHWMDHHELQQHLSHHKAVKSKV